MSRIDDINETMYPMGCGCGMAVGTIISILGLFCYWMIV